MFTFITVYGVNTFGLSGVTATQFMKPILRAESLVIKQTGGGAAQQVQIKTTLGHGMAESLRGLMLTLLLAGLEGAEAYAEYKLPNGTLLYYHVKNGARLIPAADAINHIKRDF